MDGKPAPDVDSPAVQQHLTLLQGLIVRMAENSRSCKLWCVTLVAAVLVLAARTDQPNYILLALLPAGLFILLDAYYLALERAFRVSYNKFVDKLHHGELQSADLYKLAPTGSIPKHFCWAFCKSFSILPFYLTLGIMAVVAWALVCGGVARLTWGG